MSHLVSRQPLSLVETEFWSEQVRKGTNKSEKHSNAIKKLCEFGKVAKTFERNFENSAKTTISIVGSDEK